MKGRDVAAVTRTIWRTYGVAGAWRRAIHEARRATLGYRTTPSAVDSSVLHAALRESWPFIPDGTRIGATTDPTVAIDRANRVAAGEHHAFRMQWRTRPRSASEWNDHPGSGLRYDPRAPWYRVAHFDPRVGDIKDAWEPGRFAWSFDLARGWFVSGEERFVEAFWQGMETFLDAAEPFRGVHWSCGQEAAIRALAWLWAEGAFQDAPPSTPARLGRLREALAWSAERIADASGYALSQRNNHAISEAAALVAIGARLADVDPRARTWLATGRARLDRLVLEQFAADGWYIQHSVTYARLALEQLTLAERALRAVGQGLAAPSIERLEAAVGLLTELTDAGTGEAPNHGANDGAYVLPLSTAGYRDFRPVLTAAAATFGVSLPADLVPSAEVLAWLRATPPPPAPRRPVPRLRVGSSGWVHAVSRGTRLFARAGRYRSRPGHIDPLHVDVWLNGEAVAIDAGTYRYAAPPPWNVGLSGIEVHNTLLIEGRAAARRGPRFLWLAWPAASILDVREDPGGHRVVLENESWHDAGIRHVRTCLVRDDGIQVLDDVEGPVDRPLAVTLHWLLEPHAEPPALVATVEIEVDEVVASNDSVRGWTSDGYGIRRPARSIRARGRSTSGRLRLITVFGAGGEPAARRLLDAASSTVPESPEAAIA